MRYLFTLFVATTLAVVFGCSREKLNSIKFPQDTNKSTQRVSAKTFYGSKCLDDSLPKDRFVYVPMPFNRMTRTVGDEVRNHYSGSSAKIVASWLTDFDRIASNASASYLSKAVAISRNAFPLLINEATDLKRRILNSSIEPSSYKYALGKNEMLQYVDDLIIHLSYLDFDLSGNTRRFTSTLTPIVMASNESDQRYNYLEPGSPTAENAQDSFTPSNLAVVRAIGLFHVINSEPLRANNAFKYLVERQARLGGRASFWPYEPMPLAQAIRTGSWNPQTLYKRRSQFPVHAPCSDLLMLYVDWLDIRTKAHKAHKAQLGRHSSRTLREEARRLMLVAPENAFGERAARRLKQISKY